MQGSTAIVDVVGPMISQDYAWADAFGFTSYPRLIRKLEAAQQDEAVKSVVLAINSGGGAVSGLDAVVRSVKQLSAAGKTVTAFSSGYMLSAAYWLGSSADKVVIEQSASVGSIGVITSHYEESQYLQNEGVKATVLRAGQYKALASSVEPLTTEARAQIQAGLDHVYSLFVEHVAQARKVSYPTADSTMAQGRVFYGQQALAIGLVDSVSPFESIFNQTNSTMQGGLTMPQAIAEQAELEQTAASQATTEQEATQAASTAPTTEFDGSASVIAELRAQLKDALTAQVQAEVKLQLAAQANSAQAEAVEAAKGILAGTVNNMRVALNQPTVADPSVLGLGALVSLYQQSSTQFQTTFPVGGVAVGATATTAPTESAEVLDPHHQARVRASKPF